MTKLFGGEIKLFSLSRDPYSDEKNGPDSLEGENMYAVVWVSGLLAVCGR